MPDEAVPIWQGNDWEAFCLTLIRHHYGPEQVQRVPANHKGDLGLEAFTFCGQGLQCYAAEEPLNMKDRYEKQRDKLTVDLSKLESKQSEVKTLLGTVILQRYLFMVPIFNSRQIVAHAASKTEEYRRKQLPFLSDDFRIVVMTDEAFADERQRVLSQPRELVEVKTPTSDAVSSWMGDNAELISIVDGKLSGLLVEEQKRKEFISQLMAQHLRADNALSALRPRYPDQWEAARRCVNTKESVLVLEHTGLGGATSSSIKSVAKELQQELENSVPVLGEGLCRSLAWGSVAEWLLRCPLDFPGAT